VYAATLEDGLIVSCRFKLLGYFFVCAVVFAARADAAPRCELNKYSVNPGNGFETASLVDTLVDSEDARTAAQSLDAPDVVRTYFENGKIKCVSVAQGRKVLLEINFNPDGTYERLSCATKSLIPEDRVPCGFDGKVETLLFNSNARRRAVQTLDQGKLVASSKYRNDGTLWNRLSFDQGQRIHRTYREKPSSTDAESALREERVYEPDERALTSTDGRLLWVKQWAMDDGRLSRLDRYRDGAEVSSEACWAGGARMHKSITIGTGRGARVHMEQFNIDGTIYSREILTVSGDNTGLQHYFWPNGTLRMENIHTDEPERGRCCTWVFSQKRWDESGRLVFSVEYEKDGTLKRK
jgi:hypothetical protein